MEELKASQGFLLSNVSSGALGRLHFLFHNGVLMASQMEVHCISNERAREVLLLRELGLAVGSSLTLCGRNYSFNGQSCYRYEHTDIRRHR